MYELQVLGAVMNFSGLVGSFFFAPKYCSPFVAIVISAILIGTAVVRKK